MERNDEHIDFFKELDSPFDQSEDELWESIAARTVDKPAEGPVADKTPKIKKEAKVVRMSWLQYSAAACALLLLGFGLFARFYTVTVYSKKGQHLTHTLPDGSGVELNADTEIAYHPYWWNISRKVDLAGEAFFDVAKGKNFRIESEKGVTQILGTSFNIYARGEEYKVFCKTGKVRVSNNSSDVRMVINPGELAVVDNKTLRGHISKASATETLSWKENKFVFKSRKLDIVLTEIERQFDVQIKINSKTSSELLYEGYFSKDKSVEKVLDKICLSLNLKYEKTRDGYKVY
ncbi:sensor (plasmid) [Fulvitalea axinellae]|uniref:Sensor n=1 Tax=Fulvitalea axinellae TaxID=1182444 RepID=A0AAU9CZI1_9BACT|nr:sensor [Fulvitalea axinellae]